MVEFEEQIRSGQNVPWRIVFEVDDQRFDVIESGLFVLKTEIVRFDGLDFGVESLDGNWIEC